MKELKKRVLVAVLFCLMTVLVPLAGVMSLGWYAGSKVSERMKNEEE